MIVNLIFGSLALLSLALTLWQWLVARRFPLHQRVARPSTLKPQPSVTLLKPLKGCDPATEDCLRSWLTQQYAGATQVLFGVASAGDPVCDIVRRLLKEFPGRDAQLVVCGAPTGANAKVSQLVMIERQAKHDLLMISDADVRVPPDLLADLVAPLCPVPLAHPMGEGSGARDCGLVCCFYRLANPSTLAMQWEAIATNADFWSQVLQSRSLKPIDFALGAAMAIRRQQLQEIGGFDALVDCLADDYQLGKRIARRGYSIALSPVVVECWSAPMGWAAVWKHQLRWARTIRVCQPVPYFFSLLSNATLWPLLWLIARPAAPVVACAVFCWLVRVLTALNLQQRLNQYPDPRGRASSRPQSAPADGARENARPHTPPARMQPPHRLPHKSSPVPWCYALLVPVKDLLQAAIWLLAFLGNRIEWRGERMRLRRDGTLVRG